MVVGNDESHETTRAVGRGEVGGSLEKAKGELRAAMERRFEAAESGGGGEGEPAGFCRSFVVGRLGEGEGLVECVDAEFTKTT